MDVKILNNLFLTIERGNPLKRQDQTIHRIMVHPGLLKCGKVEMESTIDQGNLIKILGIHWGKLTLTVRNLFSAETRILQGTKRLFTIERGNLCHDSLPDAGEAINDFWSMSGSFIYRLHVEPRVKLYSLREESFPIPLKQIDVTRNNSYEFGCQAGAAHK